MKMEKGIFKNFSFLKYGEQLALELAMKWRDENIQRLKKLGLNTPIGANNDANNFVTISFNGNHGGYFW